MTWRQQHSQATGRAKLPGYAPAFTFTFSPWDLTVLPSGEVVPCLGVVLHEKGLDGCRSTGPRPEDVDETAAILNARRSGRTDVPHDMTVLAFGVERRGYLGQTIDGREQAPYDGTEGEYWTDAWRRLRWVHGQPRWEVDAAGYLDFHRRVLAHFCPHGLDADQIETAERRSEHKAGPGGKPRPLPSTEAPTTEPDPAERPTRRRS